MPGRVLITGAGGFLGRHCVSLLQSSGWDVHAVGRGGCPDAPSSVATYAVDLLQAGRASNLIECVQPTHLLHLAWITTPGVYWSSPANHAWKAASEELVEAFISQGGERAVFAGTCAEYDWAGDGTCHESTTPTNPATLYGRCKNELREAIETKATAAKLSWAWGRIFFLYGPGEAASKLIPAIARSLAQGFPAHCSSGEQKRDFIHVADAADLFVRLLDSSVQGPINVGTGESVAVRDIVDDLGWITGRHDLLRIGTRATASNEPPLLVADVARSRDELGWAPQIPLTQGLAEAVNEWRCPTARAA